MVKIGSKLVHVNEGSYKLDTYRLDTGQRSDGYSGSFMTKAHRETEDRRIIAIKVLRDNHGVEFRVGRDRDWSTEDIELLLGAVKAIRGVQSVDS